MNEDYIRIDNMNISDREKLLKFLTDNNYTFIIGSEADIESEELKAFHDTYDAKNIDDLISQSYEKGYSDGYCDSLDACECS